jgi:hypothetical protein
MPKLDLTEKKQVWKSRTSKSGNKVFYRKWKGRFVNAGLFKTGHVYVTIEGKFVQEHNIKFTNEEQLFKDIDEMLETLLIIGD